MSLWNNFFSFFSQIRIANVYANVMYEEILEGVQNLPNPVAAHQYDEKCHANVEQQVTLATIRPEPIILVQSNSQDSTSNIIGTTFVQDGNRIISAPLNQVLIPTEVEIHRNLHAQTIHVERTSGASVKSSMKIGCESVAEGSLNNSNPNKNTENMNTMANGRAMASTSTNANGPKCGALFEQTANSNRPLFETIDLVSDEEEMADSLNCNQKNDSQSQSNDRRQNDEQIQHVVLSGTNIALNSQNTSIGYRVVEEHEQQEDSDGEAAGRQDVSSMQHVKATNLMVDHIEAVSQNVNDALKGIENVAGSSQPEMQRRKQQYDDPKSNEKLKKKTQIDQYSGRKEAT